MRPPDPATQIPLEAQVAAGLTQIANLQQALSTCRVIGVAVGVVMHQFDLPSDEAFDRLRRISMDTNRRVADLAEDVIHARGLAPPDGAEAPRSRSE